MNPSVACEKFRDPTLRKTGAFSRDWGYGGQLIANVHAYRATDKRRLLEVADPVGPENSEGTSGRADQPSTLQGEDDPSGDDADDSSSPGSKTYARHR